MASLSKEPNGRYTVQFVGADNRRRSIRLGAISQRNAEYAKARIEALVIHKNFGLAIDGDTAKWLRDLDDRTYSKLAKVGLVDARERKQTALGRFIDAYIEGRVDAKETTLTVMRRVRKHLVDHFGENRELQTITKGNADDWRLHLVGAGLSENTVRRHCGIAKQFMRVAVRRELIRRNPFEDLVSAVRGSSEERQYFVTRKEVAAVLDACPDSEWKTMVALSRYGGLRCPSEVLALRWCDVDFEAMRIKVRSPKTEHHEGHESRIIPLFPELEPILLQVQADAPDGAEHVITRYRDPAANLRTQFERIIDKAKLKAWPKLWHNMRASRQTELAQTFPIHVVCAWIGNSQAVAKEHYLQIRDEDFAKAIKKPVQNPVQKAIEVQRSCMKGVPGNPADDHKNRDDRQLQTQGVGVEGLEPPTSRV